MWWRWQRGRKRITSEIHPDEILIDSSNISEFDIDRFEGRIEKPLSPKSFAFVAGLLALVLLCLTTRAGVLQIARGATLAQEAQDNQLAQQVLFADRGVITDRTGVPLAYNSKDS